MGDDRVLVELEGHGRDTAPFEQPLDLSRTVGWFTTMFPVPLATSEARWPDGLLHDTKETRRQVPRGGLDWFVLTRLLDRDVADVPVEPDVRFNFHGEVGPVEQSEGALRRAMDLPAPNRSGDNRRTVVLGVEVTLREGGLRVEWRYSSALHRTATIRNRIDQYEAALEEILDHCRDRDAPELSAADVDGVPNDDLDRLSDLLEDGD
ncbi:MAG: condensation domain-containing protein [Bradymonadaceae bacterium]